MSEDGGRYLAVNELKEIFVTQKQYQDMVQRVAAVEAWYKIITFLLGSNLLFNGVLLYRMFRL